MKALKRISAMILAMVMVLGLSVTALADAPTYTISAPANGHSYEVYQIMTGDLAEKTEDGVTSKVLSNVKWGANANQTGVVPAALLEELAEMTDADAVIAKLSDYLSDEDPIQTIASGGSVSVPAGYYMIKDAGKTDMTGDAYSLHIVQVVGNVEISPKTSAPTVEKKVLENSNEQWQDEADYNIGDKVPFKLTATIGEDISMFNTYMVKFEDTLSDGFTFSQSDAEMVVKIDGNTVAAADYSVTIDETDSQKFYVQITDIKALGGTSSSVITVEFKATLNESAKIGAEGNPNTVKLIYSNDPNSTGEGETLPDTVIVYTFRLTITKSDKNLKALEGAEFTLYHKNGDTLTEVGTGSTDAADFASGDYHLDFPDGTYFTWKGLDAGTYVVKETVTPAGYNTAEDTEFTIAATYNTDEVPLLTGLTIKQDGADVATVFAADSAEVAAKAAELMEADADLTEAEALALAKFEVSAGLGFIKYSGSAFVGFNIQNQNGTVLPSTGGTGTTIFYVAGAILVIGAGLFLITRRRMKSMED